MNEIAPIQWTKHNDVLHFLCINKAYFIMAESVINALITHYTHFLLLIIRFGFLLTKCFSTKFCIKYSFFEWTTSSFERFNLSFLGKICANVLRMRIFMHKVKPVIYASEWFTGVYTTKLFLWSFFSTCKNSKIMIFS